jgi:hypothetical protein
MAPPRTNNESVERAIHPLWMDTFRALEIFIKQHDRLPFKDENHALWKWIERQRTIIKGHGRVRGLLQAERKLLESIGFFDFESRRDTPRISPIWNANFEKLKRSNGNYIRDDVFRSWLKRQRNSYRRECLQPTKIKRLDDLPFDWMTIKSNEENPSIQRSPPSSSSRISATKPTTVVEEALVPSSTDPNPAGGDFPPGWMRQSKQRSSGKVDHYWTSPAGKRFDSKKKALHYTEKCAAERSSSAARPNTSVSARKERKGNAANSRPSTVPRRPQPNMIPDGRAKNTSPHNLTKERNQRKAEVSSMVEFNSTSPFSSESSTLSLNGTIAKKIIMDSQPTGTPPKTQTFLSLWARGTELNVSYEVKFGIEIIEPKREFAVKGRTYSLLAMKLHTEGDGGFGGAGGWAKKKTIVLTYIALKGPGLKDEWNLQNKLEEIADFRSLAPNKAIARLAHFLTPGSSDHVWNLTKDNFEILDEDYFHQGCGYIPEGFIEELHHGKSTTAKRIHSLQVRCVGPCIGLIKGMLMRKAGIQKIQLPPSMRKVGPSRKNKSDWVVMIAKGLFPSTSNVNIGKYLDPESPDPCSSFLQRPAKPLSKMYDRLMVGLGVPEAVLKKYKTRAKQMKGLKHAHLKGVLDPTGMLPEDSILVTGWCKDSSGERKPFPQGLNKLFVTRAPCLEPSDAKMLQVVSRKPKQMPQASWDWLRNFSFGHIIFSVPKKSKNAVPLPAIVGEGDLDGDDYFICWDEFIIKELEKKKARHRMREEEAKQRLIIRTGPSDSTKGPPSRSGSACWLQEAQDLMLDFSRVKNVSELSGKLYCLCTKIAEESDEGIWDTDARAFGRAFKDSLDMIKHSGDVELPSHLREKVKPSHLQEYIRWV